MHVLMDRTHMFQPPRPAAAAADHGGEAHTPHKGRAVDRQGVLGLPETNLQGREGGLL